MKAPAPQMTGHYETLRRHVTGNAGAPGGEPLGLVVISRRGLAGWMQMWRQATTPPTASRSPESGPKPPVDAPVRQELAVLLAQMSVRHLFPILS